MVTCRRSAAVRSNLRIELPNGAVPHWSAEIDGQRRGDMVIATSQSLAIEMGRQWYSRGTPDFCMRMHTAVAEQLTSGPSLRPPSLPPKAIPKQSAATSGGVRPCQRSPPNRSCRPLRAAPSSHQWTAASETLSPPSADRQAVTAEDMGSPDADLVCSLIRGSTGSCEPGIAKTALQSSVAAGCFSGM